MAHANILMAFCLVANMAHARTWLVEQDGSGEYTVIQDALDAAADGDSILIGPGFYQEYRPYSFPGGIRYIYALLKRRT